MHGPSFPHGLPQGLRIDARSHEVHQDQEEEEFVQPWKGRKQAASVDRQRQDLPGCFSFPSRAGHICSCREERWELLTRPTPARPHARTHACTAGPSLTYKKAPKTTWVKSVCDTTKSLGAGRSLTVKSDVFHVKAARCGFNVQSDTSASSGCTSVPRTSATLTVTSR